MFIGGGLQVVTHKAAFPQLVDAPLPDILIKSMVQYDGDVMNVVEQKLVADAAYRDLLPEIWETHFTKVRESLPNFSLLDQLLHIWSWVLAAVGTAWGTVQQFLSDFPDWEALWPAIAGVSVIGLRYLVKWILRRMVRRGLNRLQMPNAENAKKQ